MRISDWSSDVCSSDLTQRPAWVARQPPGQGCDRLRRAPLRASSVGQASLRPRPCRRLDDAWHAPRARGRRKLPTLLPPRSCSHERAPPLPGIVAFRIPSYRTGPVARTFRAVAADGGRGAAATPASAARFRHRLRQQQRLRQRFALRRRPRRSDLPLLLRSEEHTSELQSLMRISYAVFCLKKKKKELQ